MQTVSASLMAALQSKERTVIARVQADWLRNGSFSFDPGIARDVASDTVEGVGDIGDLTGWIDSLSVDRSLSTDLPEGAKLTTGYGSAQATIELAGQTSAGMPLDNVFTAMSGGAPTWTRVTVPIRIDLGAVGSNGPEYVRQFTGRIRSLDISPEGAVTISALDGREKLRTPVKFPVTVGQTGYYYLNFAATANGVALGGDGTLSTGVGTPVQNTSDPWQILQEIAAAELGVVLFDENDNLLFYNRNRMSGGAAVATLTTDSSTFANLKAAAASESVDGIANYVTVPASPLRLDPPGTQIWALADASGVPAKSSITFPTDFDAPFLAVSTITYAACTTADGLGTNITNLVCTFAGTPASNATGLLTVLNPNAFDVFLVYTTAVPGTGVGNPALTLGGQLLREPATGGYTAIQTDPRSQSFYGVQTLDVSSNQWRQSAAAANDLATYLVNALKDPHPVLGGVEIVGDPRLQLTDRVRVVERDGLQLDQDFWLTGITTRFSAGDGLAQTVTLRAA